ncbi:DUF4365 domain-containing protein [Nocardia cyriacigeorgica]|jgi:hypothetical protein|uniref:DUF4365 domain-containing protein n=1 Tax=Nocardia cyriacigeorgica TaxID=135487 RepID=UPI000CEA4DC8|nr:DUF4365 domain-containing protein [Nocardia cyriacigeorgica]AVH22669.1 DUF4365 domain-containing protein [Nocardia cyriacigeorgica]MBF6322347.1 DUF4365 domain-containing protein [Nocardia cyriacigeorgica]PPJ14541.1 DUF4365 domain-containing protein [Nocardia cyriacigeorgica]
MAVVAVVERTFTDCMEQLQEAYVAGVAATAGCSFEPTSRDTHGIDARLVRAPDALQEEIAVGVQLKNTTMVRPDPSRTEFTYRFNSRHDMEKLAQRRKYNKKILIVMCTSPLQHEWTAVAHDRLHMVHCCYWRYLEGESVPSVNKPTIRIPTANIFDAAALTKILDQLEAGDSLYGI